jgi:N-acetylglucosaminyl-diphospho-decaprenol L-rhamnosyltransferase
MELHANVDVVVVSYNSSRTLRDCVGPLTGLAGVHVIVVDNSSTDGTLATIADLAVTLIPQTTNDGFAAGCNAGWRRGSAPNVLFLNPDARIDAMALDMLARVLRDQRVAIAAPRILDEDGSVDFSQRRFPRLASTYSHALFLHRLFPGAAWTNELVRDPAAYAAPGSPEWASGACLLVRRDVLEALGGWDAGFFMYCEDKDLCRRTRDAGYDIRYEPAAVVRHEGGASAPRASLTGVLAESRLRYARKHSGRLAAALERGGIALTALTHILVSRGGGAARAGHAAALRAAFRPAAGGSRP